MLKYFLLYKYNVIPILLLLSFCYIKQRLIYIVKKKESALEVIVYTILY